MNLKGTPYERAAAPRIEHGAILLDGRQVASTERCPHCTAHFVSQRGSGERRGICHKCGGLKTCGHPLCDLHVPFEEACDFAERRRVQQKYSDIIKADGHLLVSASPAPNRDPANR